MTKAPEYVIAQESLRCASVIPSRRCVSSRSVGWSSLLVDHHIGAKSTDPYNSLGTTDVEIGVATWGRYASEVFHGGRWRRGVYQAGAVCMHPVGESRAIRFEAFKGVESRTAMLYLPYGQVAAAAEHLRRAGQRGTRLSFNQPVESDPAVAQMAFSLVRAIEHGADDLYAQTAAAWLAVHLVTRYAPRAVSDYHAPIGVVADKRLSRAMEFMAVHFAEPLTLEALASEACVSKFHFTRLFHAKVGHTPHAFLTNIRLQAAHRMLCNSDLSVAEVGAACGYPIASNFSAAFKKKYGVPPTAIRVDEPRL